ncbi:uncharacterized protein [Rutidosis leptorrhynchoides]|uniref:uncharacterized protein n=1 Tax=Rutidosis leptorrhynchoides TaxID=125765 RepID=UPI003A9A46FE
MLEETKSTPGKDDAWCWRLGRNGLFTTKTLANLIDDKVLNTGTNYVETLRNNLVSRKVKVFIWRARKRRIPVLEELDKRGIDLHSVRCPMCDEDIETAEHSLIFCKLSLDVWSRVYAWWRFGNFNNLGLGETFLGKAPHALSGIGEEIWQAIEWTCGYLIWKNRNKKVFENSCWNPPVALSEIQVTSFEWIVKRCKSITIDWQNWLVNPKSFVT